MTTQKYSSKALLEEVILRAYIELLNKRLKTLGDNPNVFLREVKSLHANTTRKDLPDDMKRQLDDLAHSLLGFVQGQGFVLVPKQ